MQKKEKKCFLYRLILYACLYALDVFKPNWATTEYILAFWHYRVKLLFHFIVDSSQDSPRIQCKYCSWFSSTKWNFLQTFFIGKLPVSWVHFSILRKPTTSYFESYCHMVIDVQTFTFTFLNLRICTQSMVSLSFFEKDRSILFSAPDACLECRYPLLRVN